VHALIALILPIRLLMTCESQNGKRSGLERFFMNLGQSAYDSAKEAGRPRNRQ